MEIKLDRPSPKQELFLVDKHKHVAFGGARGGGKSWAIRFKSIMLCTKQAGIKVMIVRQTYPELIANHVRPLKEMLQVGASDSIATYNESAKEMRFKNGSLILFRYCSNDSDLNRYQGTEVDVLFIDEATNFTEYQAKVLTACVRGTNGFSKRIYYTCNPSGVGLLWVKRLFIDRQFEAGEDPSEYSFIQSLVTDNQALMKSNPDYIKQLEALPDKLRQAWLEGRWDVFQGMYFEEFRTTPDVQKCYEAGITVEEALLQRRYTHVIEPFEIPEHWKVYRSYDWGYGKPASIIWYAVSEDNVAYAILDLYLCTNTPNEGLHWTNKQQMQAIKDTETTHRWLKGKQIMGVADPSIWDGSHDSNGISCAEEAEKLSLWFEKGNNARVAGWMQIRERMKFDENGKAMLYFFSNCKSITRTMPLMMYDEHKPEDLNTELEDHAMDSLRYFCMSRPIPPRIIEEKKIPQFDPLNQFGDGQLDGIRFR